jgi:hypothetical protein
MTQFDGAVICEQGVTFAVVVVRASLLNNTIEANQAIASFQPTFPGLPIILMAQDGHGKPTYYGRHDLSRFMASIPVRAVPWRHYTIN